MTHHAEARRQRAIRGRKADRERRRAERKQAKREKAPVPPPANSTLGQARDPEADAVLDGIAQAVRELVRAGGVVLVARDGRPFAFYPQRARFLAEDPGAPGRLREAVERRLEEGRAAAIRAVRAGLGAR